MLSIRFSRVGRKNKAQFRVVLQQHTAAPTGGHVALLGSYDPHSKIAILKADKIKEWISKGAQVSNSAYNLFVKEGVIEGKKRAVKMEKAVVPVVEEVAPVVEEAKVEEAAPAADPSAAEAGEKKAE